MSWLDYARKKTADPSAPAPATEMDEEDDGRSIFGSAADTVKAAVKRLRAPMRMAIKQGDVPKAPAAGSLPAAAWMEIIPDVTAKAGEKASDPSPGAYTANGRFLRYDKGALSYQTAGEGAAKHEIAEAGALRATVTQADVDRAVAAIDGARGAITERISSFQDGGGYNGHYYMPKREREKAKEKPESTAAENRYGTWLRTATATLAKTKPEDFRWQVYKQVMEWEGEPSAINAYDKADVTWGSGFAATGGTMNELVLRVFEKSPEIRAAFYNAGIAIDAGGAFCVVDVERKWKLHGADADLYMRTNTRLLSLMVNCAEGEFTPELATPAPGSPDARQAVLDANFEAFLNGAAKDMPDSMLTWSVEEAALVTHARHALKIYSWSDFEGLAAHDKPAIAQQIWDRAFDWAKSSKSYKADPAGFATTWLNVIVPPNWGSLKTGVKRRPNPPATPDKKKE